MEDNNIKEGTHLNMLKSIYSEGNTDYSYSLSGLVASIY